MTEPRFHYPKPEVLAEIARTHIAFSRAMSGARCLCTELLAGPTAAPFIVVKTVSDSLLPSIIAAVAAERLDERYPKVRKEIEDLVKRLEKAVKKRNGIAHESLFPGPISPADFWLTAWRQGGRGKRLEATETWWDEPTLRAFRESLEDDIHRIDAVRSELQWGRVPLSARYLGKMMPQAIKFETSKPPAPAPREGRAAKKRE